MGRRLVAASTGDIMAVTHLKCADCRTTAADSLAKSCKQLRCPTSQCRAQRFPAVQRHQYTLAVGETREQPPSSPRNTSQRDGRGTSLGYRTFLVLTMAKDLSAARQYTAQSAHERLNGSTNRQKGQPFGTPTGRLPTPTVPMFIGRQL